VRALPFSSDVVDIDVAGQSRFSMRAHVDRVGGFYDPESQCGELDCVPG